MTNNDGWNPLHSTFKDRTHAADPEQRHSAHNLSSLLSPEPALTELVIPSFLSVIAAVEEAHREKKGLCNLDPRKIFLRSDGTVELSTLAPPKSGITVVLSSSKYSAPEMVEETTEPTDSALLDSYVLGFLFYEILLGKDLFDREFEHVISHGRFGWLTWHADKAKRAKPLSAVISGFPSVLSSLIDGMMAKEASERITNLHKIADAIGGASQTTMMMSNLSSWQDGSEAGAPLRLSVTQKVDAFWRMLVSTAAAFCDRYRRGASPRKHK